MCPQSGSLYVYARVDVYVAIDGNPPSRMGTTVPILEFVFEGLAAGEHPVLISDVIGHSESALVMIVEALPDEQEAPDWLAKWVAEVTDSPSSRRKILMEKRTAWGASRR